MQKVPPFLEKPVRAVVLPLPEFTRTQNPCTLGVVDNLSPSLPPVKSPTLTLPLLLSCPRPQHVQLLRRWLPQFGPRSQPVPGLRRPRWRGLDEEAGLPLPAGQGDVQHLQEQRWR